MYVLLASPFKCQQNKPPCYLLCASSNCAITLHLFRPTCVYLLPVRLLREGVWGGVQVWRPPQELIDSYSSGIEKVLQYQFKRRGLLQEALTHTSWPDATQQVSNRPHHPCPCGPPPLLLPPRSTCALVGERLKKTCQKRHSPKIQFSF